MPDASSDEQNAKNRAVVDALRQTVAPLIERLSPEVVPATVYVPDGRELVEESE
ncbi:MAG: hypothetical protein JO108_14260 [Acidobacteriaceae bacterium]|nr:hypothetical protein [Acidobacteriaceae bacterium]